MAPLKGAHEHNIHAEISEGIELFNNNSSQKLSQ